MKPYVLRIERISDRDKVSLVGPFLTVGEAGAWGHQFENGDPRWHVVSLDDTAVQVAAPVEGTYTG